MREVCVIGAGLLGSAVAFQLSRSAKTRVSIVDVGYPGAGTTAAGTGWVTARDDRDAGYREFALLGMEEHLRLAGSFPSSSWLAVGGTLWTEDAFHDFDDAIQSYERMGFPVEVRTAAQANDQLEPYVVFERTDLRVAHFPSDLSVVGSLLARTLYEAAVNNGAIGHFGSRVTGLESLPDHRHRLRLDDGTRLEVDAVVNAAGASADVIAGFYDIPMPMRPQPGVGILVSVDGDPLRHPLFTKDLVLKPESNGIIRLRSMLGWNSEIGPSERDVSFTGGMERNEFVAHVVEQAERLLPSVAPMRPIATKSGIRPIPSDGFPRKNMYRS